MQSVQPQRLCCTFGLFVLLIGGCDGGAKPTSTSAPAAVTNLQVTAVEEPTPGESKSSVTEQASPKSETPTAAAIDSQPSGDGAKTEPPKAVDLKEMNWDQLQELVASYKGKIVVVDVWSTSCEPCLRELPRLMDLQQRHPADVVCISFDCDYDGRKTRPVAYYRERVLKALTSLHAETVVNAMCTMAADELFQKIDLDSIPAVYVYDRTGKVAKRFDNRTPVGESEEGISYEKQIDPLVAELVKAEKN